MHIDNYKEIVALNGGDANTINILNTANGVNLRISGSNKIELVEPAVGREYLIISAIDDDIPATPRRYYIDMTNIEMINYKLEDPKTDKLIARNIALIQG
jgi:hypothetical protein